MILVTRPLKKSQIIANSLRSNGHEVMIYPLFKVEFATGSDLELGQIANMQAILVSSANVVDCLLKSKVNKNILILAIGQKTADIIQNAGFNNILIAEDSALSLLNLTQKSLKPSHGKIIYLSGDIITIDLAKKLSEKGFDSQRIVAYKTIEEQNFSDEIIEKIADLSIRQILIYSKNTAAILHKLARKHNLLEKFQNIELLCFSNEISDYCQKLSFEKSRFWPGFNNL